SVSWQYHLIPRLLNVGGTTPPSPMLRRTDQAGRTTNLVRRNTILTFFHSREEMTSHTYLGERPLSLSQTSNAMKAGHDLYPCHTKVRTEPNQSHTSGSIHE
ncbi:hypothetical protein PIB30_100483, partial [Stylosanthes scabra]|nr:hypothetical protein [Stylosanthes scabra]